MNVRLQKLVPQFLEPEKMARSAVWGRELEIPPGCLCHVVAPSGSGKTSLMHFLYRLRSDYQGEIRLNQKNLLHYNRQALAGMYSRQLSVVFQDLRLFPDHSVRDNLMIKWALAPYHPASKIEEMAERLGVLSKLDKKAGNCSYGEQQRIAIIRALLQPYELLILDEPFSHLDKENARIALELILEETKSRSASLLLADLEKIESFPADQILYL